MAGTLDALRNESLAFVEFAAAFCFVRRTIKLIRRCLNVSVGFGVVGGFSNASCKFGILSRLRDHSPIH